jgi:hypothetical protein
VLGLFASLLWTALCFASLVFPERHGLLQYICFPPMALAEVVTGFCLMLFAVGNESKTPTAPASLRWMLRCVGMYSIAELANDFRNLCIRGGDTVMLHASVRSVAEVAGGPDAIHLALKSRTHLALAKDARVASHGEARTWAHRDDSSGRRTPPSLPAPGCLVIVGTR